MVLNKANWNKGRLSDIADIIMGQSPPGEFCNNNKNGTPLLNGPTEFGSFHPTPVQYTTNARKYSQIGDILFCVRGSTTGRMNYSDQLYAIGRGIAAIRHKAGSSYQPYLKAVLEYNLPILLGSCTGSTFPNVSQVLLSNLEISIPPLETQKEIAHILGTLDDKIELNRKMNKTLEEITQTLFKHWFIDFEFPNEEGKPYKSSGGDMIDSEFGLIPKGWRVGTLGDMCSFEYGKSLVGNTRQHGKYPVMGSNGQVGWHDESLVKGPGVVVGRKGNPGTVTWVQSDFFPIDTTYFVKQTSDNVPISYVYYCLLLAGLERLSADSAVPGLNRTIAIASKTIIPETKHMVAFNITAQKNNVGIRINSDEIENIDCMRNVIIGRLINIDKKELS